MKKLLDANLQIYEKNSFTLPPSCILPSFSQTASWLLLLKSLWKCESTISSRKYKGKVVPLVIYDSSEPIFFILNVAFDVHFWCLSNKFECFVYWNRKTIRTSFFLLNRCVLTGTFLIKTWLFYIIYRFVC